MLIVGVILLIVGAVVAIAAAGRDDAVRWIGLIAALIGLVILIVAVLPADVHGAAGVVALPFWSRWRRRRRARVQIDPEFARVLASHVACGTARNQEPNDPAIPPSPDYWAREMEASATRARAHLSTIGIMLLNACKDDEVVQETLRTDLEVHETPGITHLRRVG